MKKINLIKIWDRLRSRFDLSDLQLELPTLSETVVPTTNVDDLLKTTKVSLVTSAVSATGFVTFLTVPAGKRYVIKNVLMNKSSGTWTFDRLAITKDTVQVYYDLVGSGVTFKRWDIPISFKLDPGDSLQFYVDSYTGAGNMGTHIVYDEEDAF